MKKLIALILVLSMSISVMLSASAASKVFSFYLFGRTWSFSDNQTNHNKTNDH